MQHDWLNSPLLDQMLYWNVSDPAQGKRGSQDTENEDDLAYERAVRRRAWQRRSHRAVLQIVSGAADHDIEEASKMLPEPLARALLAAAWSESDRAYARQRLDVGEQAPPPSRAPTPEETARTDHPLPGPLPLVTDTQVVERCFSSLDSVSHGRSSARAQSLAEAAIAKMAQPRIGDSIEEIDNEFQRARRRHRLLLQKP